LERIADHAVAVAKAGEEISHKTIVFSDAAKKELAVLQRAVKDIVACSVAAFNHDDMTQAMSIEPREQVIDQLVKDIKSRHVRRLRDGLCSVEYGFVLEDLLTAYGRTADHCSNVAVEMLQVSQGKLEAHEYLGALKSGQLQESAKFTESFQAYRKQYSFEEE
jgi:phosphate:Na+ symporter